MYVLCIHINNTGKDVHKRLGGVIGKSNADDACDTMSDAWRRNKAD